MKKSILFLAIILLAVSASGQSVKKGNLVGIHTWTLTLKPGVTMEQFIDIYNKQFIPTFEKHYIGWNLYLVKSIRGETSNKLGTLIVIKSEKDRDKYFNPDGSYTELGKSVNNKIMPAWEELAKYGEYTSVYTDWLIL